VPAITELAQQGTQDPRRWRILVVILLAQLMIVLDATVVNVALPSAQSALGFSTDSRQWIITAYTLAFGSMLLVGGKLGDIFGRKRTLVVGLCGFAIASAVGGAAPSFAVFVGARALQGAFAGLIAPAVLSLLSTTFTDPADRNKAFGIYGAVLISGASIGLLLGGALTEYIDWRAVMYINVVFAVLPVTGALKLLRNEVANPKPRLDVPGALAVSSGLFALVFAFSWAETNSWREPVTIALLVAGVLLLALFVGIESRVAQPLLPLRVLRDRNRGASYISMLIASAALFGVLIFLGFYLQQNEGYSPVVTGLAFLPMTLAVVVTSPTAQTKLRPRFGPRPLVVIGMLSGAAGMLYLSRVDVQSSYTTDILPALVALGVGLGLVFSSATNSGTLGVQPGDASVASATVNASQQIGASLGTALLSTLSASAVSSYLTGLRPTPAALAAASVHGYAAAFGWAALILAVGALIAGALYRRQVPERHPVAAPAVAH
jgi:EmrB/QacA subfamily drug resistance transporter